MTLDGIKTPDMTGNCRRGPFLREQGVGSSNLPAPTNEINDLANW